MSNFAFLSRGIRLLKTQCTLNIIQRNKSDVGVCIRNHEVKHFIVRSMVAVGTKEEHAECLADNLTMADYRGHFSHGLNRLEMYIKDIKSGCTVSDTEPCVLAEAAATAYVDGNNLLGPVVGVFCMQMAINKAIENGIGMVVAKGSNHFGIAGFYSLMACDRGLLGMAFTNTSPLVFPTRGRQLMLGTNPISLAAPGLNNDNFVLDMATSSVALGKVELSAVKKEQIPKGWGADERGQEATNPDLVINGGGLLPLGGTELSSGYKGYGLAAMVEVLCGVLGGAHYGNNIRRWKETNSVADLGQCFIAINHDSFSPSFSKDLQNYIDSLRSSKPSEGEKEVLVAGDPERLHMQMCDDRGGITYHPNVISLLDDIAAELKIDKIVRQK